MSGCGPPTRLIPVFLVIYKLSRTISGSILVVLSSAISTTEVLSRLAIVFSPTRIIISVLTIGLPLLVTIRWRRIILMRSVIFTISTIVCIVLLIFNSLGKCYFQHCGNFSFVGLLPDQIGNQGSFGVC